MTHHNRPPIPDVAPVKPVAQAQVAPQEPIFETPETVEPVAEAVAVVEVPQQPQAVTAPVDSFLEDEGEPVTPVPEASVKAQEVPEAPRYVYKRQYTTMVSPVSKEGQLETGEDIELPSAPDEVVRRALDLAPNISMVDSPESRRWASIMSRGLEMTTYDAMFTSALEDPTADFRNENEYQGNSLSAVTPKVRMTENSKIQGENAVLRAINHLGLGSVFQVPLWGAGIWVTFKPPSETELIELNRQLASDKILFGRYTYGLAFSNTTSYTIDRLFNFALDHVYNTTVDPAKLPLNKLKSFIPTQEIPSFLWGFLCTMYPRGFNYARSCSADPEKCRHVVEEIINLTKLQWSNIAPLTDWQKAFMSGRQPHKKSLEEVERYQLELTKLQKRRFVFFEGEDREIAVTLRSPKVTEYIDAGHRWIGGIVEAIDKIADADLSENDRNNLITHTGQATTLRQYVHFIESIELATNIIEDRETIETTVERVSGDDEVRTKIIEAVKNYINDSTISLIGLPVFDCPNCHGTNAVHEDNKMPNHPNIIPLDVIQLFFELVNQRLTRIAER